MDNWNEHVDHILVSETELKSIVADLAKRIDADFANSQKRIVLLGILKGSIVFMGDLMKKLSTPVDIEFMKVSSYGSG